MSSNNFFFRAFLWRWRIILIVSGIVTIAIILVRLLGLLQPVELFAYDVFVSREPSQPQDERIVIVGIGEEDVEKIGTAIIADGIYADLLAKILQANPRAIGLDVYRDVPIPPGTDKLERIFRDNKHIIGIEKTIGDTRQMRVKPNPILKTNNQIGFNDIVLDRDNKLRRALIALPDKKAFSLAMYTSLLYLARENINLTTTEKNNYWQLKDTVLLPFESNDGSYVNADSGGYQILLDYRGNTNHFQTFSLFDVLDSRLPQDWARDKIVLIGFVGESFQDVHLTPYTTSPDQRMAGVEIHANIASQIISSVIDDRPLIKTWSEIQENSWIFIWTVIGASITWSFRRERDFYRGIILLILAMIISIAICYLAFVRNWWIPIVPPIIGLVGSAGGITVYNAYNAAKIRRTFGRYLSTEIVNTLLESPAGVRLGGERRVITILTSDLRGFTAISERLAPEEVVRILNFYLGYMADIISEYRGTIDEFMGDGILVLFGAPLIRKDDPDRAVACAIAMQLAMDEVNQQMEKWGYRSLKMGIGINTGEVVVGNIGSEKRSKYGVVGSEVNLTYRIESYTQGREIFISETTYKSLQSQVAIAEQKQVAPKGVPQPINIYKIVGLQGKHSLSLPEIEEQVVSLTRPLNINYSLLNDKDISAEIYSCSLERVIVKGVEKGAYITIDLEGAKLPKPLNNLKLNLADYPDSDDIYGKVISIDSQTKTFKLYFTYLSGNTEKIMMTIDTTTK